IIRPTMAFTRGLTGLVAVFSKRSARASMLFLSMVDSFGGAVGCSAVVFTDRRGVSAQGRHLDLHEGVEGQRLQQLVQLVDAVDIEDADVGVLAGDAPDVAPFAAVLQLLRKG